MAVEDQIMTLTLKANKTCLSATYYHSDRFVAELIMEKVGTKRRRPFTYRRLKAQRIKYGCASLQETAVFLGSQLAPVLTRHAEESFLCSFLWLRLINASLAKI
jgi:hypothetical protein